MHILQFFYPRLNEIAAGGYKEDDSEHEARITPPFNQTAKIINKNEHII